MTKIDTSKWKEYKIEDLFTLDKPVARSKNDYNEGTTPFVASGNFNNGIECYLSVKNSTDFDAGNCLTVSPVDGSTFYQEKDFLGRGGAGSSILILRNEKLNKFNGLFLSSIIRKVCSKYSYNNMGNQKKLKEEIIYLPVKNDEPDWEYMENYIKKLMEIKKKDFSNLMKVI